MILHNASTVCLVIVLVYMILYLYTGERNPFKAVFSIGYRLFINGSIILWEGIGYTLAENQFLREMHICRACFRFSLRIEHLMRYHHLAPKDAEGILRDMNNLRYVMNGTARVYPLVDYLYDRKLLDDLGIRLNGALKPKH